ELQAAVERCGLSVSEFVPVVGMLASVLEGERLIWADGQVLAEVEVHNGTWTSLRRRRRPEAGVESVGRPTPALAALDHGHLRWAPAFAAATARGSTRIALRPGSADAARRRSNVVRGLAVAAVLIAGASLISVPGFAAWYTGAKADRMLDSLQTAAAQIARANYELQRVSAQESEIAEFAASRRSFTELLGSLSIAMPDSTAM